LAYQDNLVVDQYKEVSQAQLVGRVVVQTQHPSSNPHGHELRFLFILKAQAGPGTYAIYLEDYALILTKIKNLSTHAKWLCASLVGAEAGK
jgi:hypothetical protein